MTESASSTPHTDEPAEGAEAPGQEDSGRTPHTDEPAEGSEEAAAEGVDPDNRISGA
ncbi:hypothetical protein [Modestobacter versicolor]|uniref:hypothetical protein n=1 Tax=Modestobacter versicolor TaxID=429133 RepID=UPI0034DF963E